MLRATRLFLLCSCVNVWPRIKDGIKWEGCYYNSHDGRTAPHHSSLLLEQLFLDYHFPFENCCYKIVLSMHWWNVEINVYYMQLLCLSSRLLTTQEYKTFLFDRISLADCESWLCCYTHQLQPKCLNKSPVHLDTQRKLVWFHVWSPMYCTVPLGEI